jgi:hypothetical protein
LGTLSSLAVSGGITCTAFSMTSTTSALGLPSMTNTQKLAISSPASGSVVYDSTQGMASYYANTIWRSPGSMLVTASTTAATYTLTAAVDVLVLTASSNAIALTLPNPTLAANINKVFTLIRTDTNFSYAVTITATGGATIAGSSTRYMWTANEVWVLVSDGSVWQKINHVAMTDWINAGAISVNGFTKGSGGVDQCWWQRIGCNMNVRHIYTKTSGGSGASTYVFNLPYGLTHTLAGGSGSDYLGVQCVGTLLATIPGVGYAIFDCFPYNNAGYYCVLGPQCGLSGSYGQQGYSGDCTLRVTNWDEL